MKCQLALRRFGMDLDILRKKIDSWGYNFSIDNLTKRPQISGNLDTSKLSALGEVDRILLEEKEKSPLNLENLRKDVIEAGKKYSPINLRIRTYGKLAIPANAIKKKLANPLKTSAVHIDSGSENNVLIELFKEQGKPFYRLFYYKEHSEQGKTGYQNISVLVEEPRLIDEISDFLRLCLIFGLKFRVICKDKNRFMQMLNKAKSITKGKLSGFDVDVVKSLDDVKGVVKLGFSKHADKDEGDLIMFLKENSDKPLLFVFGNDLYGLTQETRDKVDCMFRLTKERKKPLKGNQALSYVLGIYSVLARAASI